MSLEDKFLTIQDETNRLLDYANTPLPESQGTLGDAVKALVDGYGGGGGSGIPDPVRRTAFKVEASTSSQQSYRDRSLDLLVESYGFTIAEMDGDFSDAWKTAIHNGRHPDDLRLCQNIMRYNAAPISGYPFIGQLSRTDSNFQLAFYGARANSIGNGNYFYFLSSDAAFEDLDPIFRNSCTPVTLTNQTGGSASIKKLQSDGTIRIYEQGCYKNETGSEIAINAIVGTYNNNNMQRASTIGGSIDGVSGALVFYYRFKTPIIVPAGHYLFWNTEAYQ